MLTFLEYSFGKKLYDTIGNYKVYMVDAPKIRDSSLGGDEFNHFGTHLEFPKIVPNNEIWVSKEISDREREFLIHNGVNQYEAKKKKIKDWYDYALRLEKAEREKVDGVKFNKKCKPSEKLYDKKYCIVDGITVWLVDGERVRDTFKTDFILGANPEAYKWTPKNEIWIEKDLLKDKDEIPLVILHEFVEMVIMKFKKLSYNKAHPIASKVEFEHRNKKFDKSDIEAINSDKALLMAKKYL